MQPARRPSSPADVVATRFVVDSLLEQAGFELLVPRCTLEPVDDLAAGSLPHALAGADVAEHLVKMSDAPRVAHGPWVLM